jgi:hypothetical protein
MEALIGLLIFCFLILQVAIIIKFFNIANDVRELKKELTGSSHLSFNVWTSLALGDNRKAILMIIGQFFRGIRTT